MSQILPLHCVISEVKEHNLSAILSFVDLKKAFASINRDKIFNVLLAYGIPSQIVKGMKELYLNTMAQVVTKDDNTNFFLIIAGVQQDHTLAPYLFITVLDYVMRITMAKDDNFGITLHQQRGRHCLVVHLTYADFADDIALLSDTINEVQALLNAVESATQSVGLVMNSGKTKFMRYEQDSQIQSLKSLEGKSLECVTNFEYLGSWISTTFRDIASHKVKTWPALHKLDNIWKSNLPRWL